MQQFMRKFTQLNGKMGKVTLDHCLFGKQIFYCDRLQTINDDKKVGVLLRGNEVFVSKHDVKIVEVQDDVYKVSDGRLTITIILK